MLKQHSAHADLRHGPSGHMGDPQNICHPGVAVPRQAATRFRLPVRVYGRVAERERVPLGKVPGHRNGCQRLPINCFESLDTSY
eukprot:6142352-Heterocapsa_arctica.AAC.1